MRALIIKAETGEAHLVDIPRDNTLKAFQEAVGGWVECVALPRQGVDMWLNEEGKLIGLPMNATATRLWESEYGRTDVMMGDVVITGAADSEGNATDIDDQSVMSITLLTLANF